MPAQLDIIIPIYNEADTLVELVGRLDKSLRTAKISYSLIAIDDNSSDSSLRILHKLSQKFPLRVVSKVGQRGKAFSILQGAQLSDAPYVAMIDADLQYPPEVLPDMLRLTQQYGVVVARRQDFNASKIRQVISRSFQWFFGKLLYGLDCDIQSGLKVFKRDVIEKVPTAQVTAWTLDIPLLITALDLGYSIGQVDITFAKRAHGQSKINLVTSIREIGGRAISFRLRRRDPFVISPDDKTSMVGAGLIHRGRRFVTHSTLSTQYSALHVVTAAQRTFLLGLLVSLLISFTFAPLATAIVFVGVLSTLYFADVLFNLFVLLKSLHQPPEIQIPKSELQALQEKDLPIYTILCPLYKEAHILPQFVENISQLDWPKKKLDVILLLEADDVGTIEAAEAMNLPNFVSIRVVPDSQPKTKPKACNYGLHFAKGEYLVIYDAEDAPDPLQLKKVYAAFQKTDPNIKCIQAKLNFYNPHQNLLTRFFTAEYSLWFDVVLTGLQSINTTIPLGGTSNHFRTADLRELEGWDPFNVTEDCDLGIRLFQRGARTAVIDSITLEEANSRWGNWLRQRSRWIKGYMQTYLVHMRQPLRFAKEYGWHALLFQLVVGGKIAFMLINPFLWLLTLSYFVLNAWVGPTIEALYPSVIFYMAVTSLIFGNFMFIYYYMIGAAKREHWTIIKWVFLVPVYWLLVSTAAAIALYELIRKPHYWQKTVHGLHVKKEEVAKVARQLSKKAVTQVMTEALVQEEKNIKHPLPLLSRKNAIFTTLHLKARYQSLKKLLRQLLWGEYSTGLWLVVATIVAHGLNMLTSLYYIQELHFADFAIINTFTSLLVLIGIPASALSATVNHRTAFLLGKFKQNSAQNFWIHLQKRALVVMLVSVGAWLIAIPWLTSALKTPSLWPLLLFTPLIITSILGAVNEGYLRGKMVFGVLALTTFLDPFLRLIFSLVFDLLNQEEHMYVPIMLSFIVTFAVASFYAQKGEKGINSIREFRLPIGFFNTALISKLSGIAFFSLDNLIVAYYLSGEDTGAYGMLGLIGKMIFFAGSLSEGFILPLISRKEGKKENSEGVFNKLLLLTLLLAVGAYSVFGLGLPAIAPVVFGEKMNAIRSYLPIYGFGILLYTISQTIIQYHLAKRHYVFPITALLSVIIQVGGLMFFHSSLNQVVLVMLAGTTISSTLTLTLHLFYKKLEVPLRNIQDFLELLSPKSRMRPELPAKDKYNILILNWRDPKHVWAGGAEKYIFEIAKRLVKNGHRVTLFTGNDGKNARNEKLDGVQIIRRGGFYTVYIWAFLYYILRLRKYTDLIIDCENGIPFLTPAYARKPIYLLIHHIHQEVFMTHLRFPLSEIAALIESDVMSFLYKDKPLITVSESSKEEIMSLGLGKNETVNVVNPGIDAHLFAPAPKTKQPSLLYLGRLKPYKQIDVALKAFAKVLTNFPTATFTIAGSGEALEALQKLARKLQILEQVTFVTEISDSEKAKLYAESWVAVQPSTIEGWGITVIEANASGTPVVASNVKGLRDSVVDQKTGILVPPGNSGAFATAISTLFLDKKLRQKLSKNAVVHAQQYNWDLSYQKFAEVLRQSGIGNKPESVTLAWETYEK